MCLVFMHMIKSASAYVLLLSEIKLIQKLPYIITFFVQLLSINLSKLLYCVCMKNQEVLLLRYCGIHLLCVLKCK
jgi:hypothetical protein